MLLVTVMLPVLVVVCGCAVVNVVVDGADVGVLCVLWLVVKSPVVCVWWW